MRTDGLVSGSGARQHLRIRFDAGAESDPAAVTTMRITLRLFASLTEYLPAAAIGHEIEVDVAEDATPLVVLDQFGIPRELVHLVMVDGVYIAPKDRATFKLKAHSKLAMFPAIAGG
jgi:hypothetical protein